MDLQEALDWAIFCLNTHMSPESSDDETVADLDTKADDVIARLDQLRTQIRTGKPVSIE